MLGRRICRKSGISNDKADWAMQKEVFMKYVQVSQSSAFQYVMYIYIIN